MPSSACNHLNLHVRKHPSPTRRSSDLKELTLCSGNERQSTIRHPVKLSMFAICLRISRISSVRFTEPLFASRKSVTRRSKKSSSERSRDAGPSTNRQKDEPSPDRKSTRLNSSH